MNNNYIFPNFGFDKATNDSLVSLYAEWNRLNDEAVDCEYKNEDCADANQNAYRAWHKYNRSLTAAKKKTKLAPPSPALAQAGRTGDTR